MKGYKFSILDRVIVFFFLLCLIPSGLLSQMAARGLGMGGAYTALARGVHAPIWNPANLGLPDNPKFSMTFFSIETGVWNNSLNKGMYDKYFVNGDKDQNGNIVWEQQDVEDILNHIPDNGLGLNVEVFVRTLCFSAGRFAFSFGANVGSFVQLDKTLFELPLAGNELNKKYTLNNMDGEALGIGAISFSLGEPVKVSFADVFAVGGTFHLFYWGGYAKVDSANFSFTTASYGFDIDGNYKATRALGGLGWGVDMGAAAQIGEKLTLSFELANVLGSIPWSNEIKSEVGYIRGDSLTVLNADENSNDEDVVDDSSWTVEGEKFSTKLPIAIRLGCLYREGAVVLTADYYQSFKNGAWSSSKPRFAVGTEWQRIPWLPLRAGVVLGGRIGFGTSFGFGIRPGKFVLDLGIMNRGFIFPKNSKGLIIALDMGVGF